MMRNWLALLMLIAGAAHAAPPSSTPLVYNREILTINSSVEVPNPAYVAKPAKPKDKSAKIPKTFTQTRAHVFYITAESSDAMSKSWFINSTNIKGNKGVLYLLDEPAIPTISPSSDTQHNDILFIGSYGAIKGIAKNISPAELAEPMELEVAVKAMLYLEAGTADKLGIKPFDMVDYSAFPKQPNLMK